MVDSCRTKLVNVISGSASRKCFGPAVVFPVHLGVFSIQENKLFGYAEDCTLVTVVPSLIDRVTVVDFLNLDLNS